MTLLAVTESHRGYLGHIKWCRVKVAKLKNSILWTTANGERNADIRGIVVTARTVTNEVDPKSWTGGGAAVERPEMGEVRYGLLGL